MTNVNDEIACVKRGSNEFKLTRTTNEQIVAECSKCGCLHTLDGGSVEGKPYIDLWNPEMEEGTTISKTLKKVYEKYIYVPRRIPNTCNPYNLAYCPVRLERKQGLCPRILANIPFREILVIHVPYIIVFYAALFSMIGVSFEKNKKMGSLVIVTFLILIGCLIYYLLPF